jgi:hypothetical protein
LVVAFSGSAAVAATAANRNTRIVGDAAENFKASAESDGRRGKHDDQRRRREHEHHLRPVPSFDFGSRRASARDAWEYRVAVLAVSIIKGDYAMILTTATKKKAIHRHAQYGREGTYCGRGQSRPAFITRDWAKVTCPRCLRHAPKSDETTR